MPARNLKEAFLMLLGNAGQNTERAADIYQKINQAFETPDVREAHESTAFGVKRGFSYERQQH